MNCSLVGVGAFLGIASNLALAAALAPNDHFEFRLPRSVTFHLEQHAARSASAPNKPSWLRAWREDGSTNFVEFGDRVVLQLKSPGGLSGLMGRNLRLARVVTPDIFILQATDAGTAMQEAHRLAALPEVTASYPVMRRQVNPDSLYAQRSNDPFFGPYFLTGFGQRIDALWPLENIDLDGTRLGLDLNVMSAWPFGSGQGITVAVADTGVDLGHAELTNRLDGSPHFNFFASNSPATPFGGDQSDPYREFWSHGTGVAGLIAAEGNNGRGMIGVAPRAQVASWVIFATNLALVSDESLMEMYQFASDQVSIQNHSWGKGNGDFALGGPTLLEQVGISNAISLGRDGLGSVMVRPSGNDRSHLGNTDDDGYMDNPWAITVAAVNKNGRATSYSNPGASILVSAPGGGGDSNQGLFTLDLSGSSRGINSGITYPGDLSDYRWGVQGLMGTSASAPLVSGVVALVLSVNPKLTYRDVQQIMLLSARQWDSADPDLVTNAAGLVVSHNTGFGVPDAGHAVWLAQFWSNRPPCQLLSISNNQASAIPANGLRVEVTGNGVPALLTSLVSGTAFGPHADDPTAALPLVDIGLATNIPSVNLTNKGALVQRGTNTFADKINHAAQAGAAFVVIYNTPGDDSLINMLGTDYTTVPAVFIRNSDGEALKALFQTNISVRARISLQTVDYTFHVSESLLCEQVAVRVRIDYPVRGDLRLTLLSPKGTRSVLQQVNGDGNPAPADWTFWSTHHFFESSIGDWKVSVGDEANGFTGTVQSVNLIIRGTPILDSDQDGLDDNWELAHFGSLAYGPQDDLDGDGFSNAREQVMGTNPLVQDVPFKLDLTPWQLWGNQRIRLSWPSATGYSYEVWGGTNVSSLNLLTNVPGSFPQTEWFAPSAGMPEQFFRVHARASR
jgi:subtilisin family serine protease/subtilisin-like proprotein convertase family protein